MKLRGAIVGYGAAAMRVHLPAFLQRAKDRGDLELTAIADVCEERRYLATQIAPEARIYTDGEILLESEAENLDFVDIATPTASHFELVRQSLEHGLHVLCESPLTLSSAEVKELGRLATARKRVLFPCHYYRYAPAIKAIRDALFEKPMGEVRGLSLQILRHGHPLGASEWRPDWRREPRFAGQGIGLEEGGQALALLFDWASAFPSSVSAKTFNLEAHRYPIEDNLTATLQFPHGLAQLNLSWTAGANKLGCTVSTEKGIISVEDDHVRIARLRGDSDSSDWDVERKHVGFTGFESGHASWFQSLLVDFERAVAQEEYEPPQLEAARRALETIEVAYRSAADNGRELTLG